MRAVIRAVPPDRQSLAIAVVCLAVDVAALLNSPLADGSFRVVCLVLIVVLDAGLALPTRWSGWVALAHVVAGVGTALAYGGSHGAGVLGAGTLIAAYRAGAWLTGRPAWWSLLVLCAGSLGTYLILAPYLGADWIWIMTGAATNAAVPWMVGRFNRMHQAHLDDVRHQRETERREARAAVEKAVAEERTAIARDLHDVISHHVSAIGVHAGAARLALNGHPGRAAESLGAVEASSRSAMADLRKMLDVLHGAGDGAEQPGLANLDELLDGVRSSGLPARLVVHGQARPLPGSLDVALYRIGQEMLTNALRHGDGGPVELSLTYAADAVTLVARNGFGPIPARPGITRGLAGIRTRAAMFSGVVACGRTGDERWETAVTVPTTEVS